MRTPFQWFNDEVNWCEGTLSSGDPKPTNRVYAFFERWWFWPLRSFHPWTDVPPCACCAAVRGLVYGFMLGWILT